MLEMDADIYLRKSRLEEQSNETETLQKHRESLLKIADSKKLNVNQVFEEVVSGESLYARPQMLALLEKVETGKVDAVLCMDIDRLGRGGMRDQGIILDVFKESGTLIITPDHTYDLSDDSDEQLTEFKAFISRQEYKQITKRLQRGKLYTVQAGYYISPGAPYGYRKLTVNRKPILEIVEDEAKYVRMIFSLYCDRVGCDRIAEILNAAGAKPRRTDRFKRATIMAMLRNPIYIGKTQYQKTKWTRKDGATIIKKNPKDKWLIIDGLHEAIITDEQFEKVQEIIQQKYIPPTKDGSIVSPVVGLIKCGVCGGNMQRTAYKDGTKGFAYLRCLKKGCQNGTKFQYIEQLILVDAQNKLKKIKSEVKSTTVDYADIIKNIDSELIKAEKQETQLYDYLEQGLYDVDIFKTRMSKLKSKIDELAKQKEENEAKAQEWLLKMEQKDNITTALDQYMECDAEGKNRLLKTIIDYIVYYKDRGSKEAEFRLDVFYK
jgi:site-specific DNA recombinase